MATSLISFPFRLAPNGSVVTRPDNTAEYYGEELAQMILTKAGERILVPSFGMDDPTFQFIDQQELSHKVTLFALPIRISGMTTRQVTDTTQEVLVSYQLLDQFGTARINLNNLGI